MNDIAGGPISQQIVFLDLDSTLCSTWHRRHLINWDNIEETDWDAYALACEDDPVFPTVRQLVYDLACLYKVVIVSGRSGVAREATERWLRKHQVPHDELVLRQVGDRSPNEVFKIKTIKKWLDEHPGTRVRFLVDDWSGVVDLAEKEGWNVLLVNPNYPWHEVQGERPALIGGLPV